MEGKYLLSRGIIILAAVALVAGCTGPRPSSEEAVRKALSVGTKSSVQDYVLGPTDVVQVSVWRNPDLSISVPVRPDGRISVNW